MARQTPVHGAWEPIAEFLEAGGTTPQTQMRFNDACNELRRQHGTSSAQFHRALFKTLVAHTGLTRMEAAKKFGFSEDDLPVDVVDEAPEIARELADANQEMSAAVMKVEAARQRQAEADARLARIDELKATLPQLKESLDFVESLPAQLQSVIDGSEKAMNRGVYSLPRYSLVGNSVAFICRQQADIEAARAALAAHPERVKKAREAVAEVKAEIAQLKKTRKAK